MGRWRKDQDIVSQSHRESGLLSKIRIYFCSPNIFFNILRHTTAHNPSSPFFPTAHYSTQWHTTAHGGTLQHTTHLLSFFQQHTTAHSGTLQHMAAHYSTQLIFSLFSSDTLQHTAAHYSTWRHITAHYHSIPTHSTLFCFLQ